MAELGRWIRRRMAWNHRRRSGVLLLLMLGVLGLTVPVGQRSWGAARSQQALDLTPRAYIPNAPVFRAPLRINAGGPAQTIDGASWIGCAALAACGGYLSGGFAYTPQPLPIINNIDWWANQALYQSEWAGGATNGVPPGGVAFAFNVPVVNGGYTVRLHFAENSRSGVGQRIFDVNIEGGPAELTNFDLFAAAGGMHKALVREFPTAVTDGVLTIAFIRRVENAKISAIEILPAGFSEPVPTPAPIGWTTAAAAPQTLFESQGLAVGGKLYVFGGFYNTAIETTRRAQVYDPATNHWTPLADLPEDITHAGHAADGDTIYLVGGFVGDHPGSSTTHVWKYHIPSNSWSAGPPLPAPRASGAAVRLGRALHYFGGTLRESGVDRFDSPDHWVLDLDGGTRWVAAAPLPNPRNHMGGAALDGKIYAVGGQHLADEVRGNQSAVHVYDPATNAWQAVADLPLPLGHISASTFVRDGRIVVVGGVTQNQLKVADVLEYDPAANRWVALTPLPVRRQSPVADAIDGRLVVTGGADSAPQATTWIGSR